MINLGASINIKLLEVPALPAILKFVRTTSYVVFLIALLVTTALGDDFDRGLQAVERSDFSAAIKYWNRYLDKHPKSHAGYVNRGSTYMLSGHVPQGIVDWNKALEFTPPFVYAVYTGVFIRESRLENRLHGFTVSLELDPDYTASVIMAGILMQDLGKSDLAAELYLKSRDLTKNPLLKSRLEHWVTLINAARFKSE